MTRKLTGQELVQQIRSLEGHPMADVLLEDLVASREHGRQTARVGIAPDGNPIIYGRNRKVVDAIGKTMQDHVAVYTRFIPDLSEADYQVLGDGASQRLLPEVTEEMYNPSTPVRSVTREHVEIPTAGRAKR